MPVVLTILQDAIELAVATGLVALIAWLWRSGKRLRDTVTRLEAAMEAQAAENALLHTYIERLNEVDEKYQDSLRGDAHRALIRDFVDVMVSTKQLKKDVAELKEDLPRIDALETQVAKLESGTVAGLLRRSPGVERIEQHAALKRELGEDGFISDAPRGR